MNEKILRQVEEMKKQTIGVEVEMNSITREKAASIAPRRMRSGLTVMKDFPLSTTKRIWTSPTRDW